MSQSSRRKRRAVQEVQEAGVQTISPEQQKLNQLMRDLVVVATRLVFKVATCDCNHKDNCEVYKVSKELAKLVDEISSLRPVSA